jgi:hypothetical protein
MSKKSKAAPKKKSSIVDTYKRLPSIVRSIMKFLLFGLIEAILIPIISFIVLSFVYWDINMAFDWIMKNIDLNLVVYGIAIVVGLILIANIMIIYSIRDIHSRWKYLFILIVFVISLLYWMFTTRQVVINTGRSFPLIYTLTSTSTATYTSTNTPIPTNTPTVIPTHTNTLTPTNIYDPIRSVLIRYFDHIPNNREGTNLDYDLSWLLLDNTYQIKFKCSTCGSAKGGWIWYVSQYYFNINPDELYKSGNIDIMNSYAKADINLEKIEIKSGSINYNGPISICLIKRQDGWKISSIYEKGRLPETNNCIL